MPAMAFGTFGDEDDGGAKRDAAEDYAKAGVGDRRPSR